MNREQFYTFAKSDNTYKTYGETRSTLADKALEYAFDWHVQNPKAGTKNGKSLRQNRKECKLYVKNRFRQDRVKAQAYGFVIPAWILSIILNVIISWVIRRLLDDWLFKQ